MNKLGKEILNKGDREELKSGLDDGVDAMGDILLMMFGDDEGYYMGEYITHNIAEKIYDKIKNL